MPILAIVLLVCPQDDEDGFLGIRERALNVTSESVDFTITGIIDLEYYLVDDDPPGLLFDTDSFFNPRVTLFAELLLEEDWFFFLQARIDRGFDPNYMDDPQFRADEWFARYTLGDEDWSLSLQAGRFATPLGNFVPRHTSMQNPLVRAPMVYDHVTTVGDNKAPAGNAAFLKRRDIDDLKHDWVTMIWGPVYHTGAMAFANVGRFDFRFAVTGSAPSERPPEWEHSELDFDTLAYSARVGWNPFIGFKAGLNWAYGPYLRERAERTLPPGRDREDYPQRLVGLDLEYSIDHFIFFAEVYWSDWDAPTISGDLSAVGYYIEARYKIRPGLFVAARWNQMLFDEIPDGTGGDETWDRNSWRIELGVGYFLYVNLLAKAQVEFNETRGPNDPDDTTASFSLSLAF